ncbi:hypothetical protein MVEN_01656600 [Mycena venus]|uniref:Uncharacterized protein n=1 Tax=Mycena venus TaxID=2733690 RepID=A0A8H6XND6_9AGAR|nr:hypothetical protein MVEN_01656600 [Mycena venus]
MSNLIAGDDATAPIVSLGLLGIVYGFSVCLFGTTVWVLLFQRGDRKINAPMLIAAVMLWIFSTCRMFIGFALTIDAFVNHIDEPLGPEIALSNFAGSAALLDNAVYGMATLVGDAVVIYRCYVVWDRFDIIVLPTMGWCASFAMVAWILNSLAQSIIDPNQGLILYATTLSTNLLATVLLAFRLWRADRDAQKINSPHGSLQPLLIVVMESGALYTIMLILAMVSMLNFLAMEFVVNTILPAMISITFSMIFIRVGLFRNQEHMQYNRRSFPLSNLEFKDLNLDSSNQISSTATMENSTVNMKSFQSLGGHLTGSSNCRV